jgi:hypothetical protein
MDRTARGANAKVGRFAARKTSSHRPDPEACTKGCLCSGKAGTLFTLVGALQNAVALLKALAIGLRNAD